MNEILAPSALTIRAESKNCRCRGGSPSPCGSACSNSLLSFSAAEKDSIELSYRAMNLPMQKAHVKLQRMVGPIWANLMALIDDSLPGLAGKRTDLPHPSIRRRCRQGR